MSKQIQWFPGHMSKTLREFKEIKTDLYFLLLDSRAPDSTFIDSFKEIINDKKVIILFTKSDLVNKDDLSKYITKYKNEYFDAKSISLNESKKAKSEIIKILDNIKFKSFLPKIVILGAPNVGKSTLLNIIIGRRKATVQDRPGITKKNDWYQIEKKYWVLDTPGVLQPKFIEKKQGINLAIIGSIKLDILPLDEVALGLLERLNDLNIINEIDVENYLENLIQDSIKPPNEVYKKIIRDFWKLKYGKIILD